MTFDWKIITESKRSFRSRLAQRPIAEKLRLLDAMREREVAIRGEVAPGKAKILKGNSPHLR